MDYIHISNLSFKGKHGHFEHERKVEQEFAVDVVLSVDTAAAGKSDKLDNAVDYSEVKKKIQDIIEGSSRYLLEKLAEDIAQAILADKRVDGVKVKIKKTAVWDNGVPGVTILRKQKGE